MHKKSYGGTNRNRHRMRCSQGKKGCGSRFTLKKHPDQYKRTVKCPYCKSTHVNNVEKARRTEQLNNKTCHCDNYPFPHVLGSFRFCEHHPLRNVYPNDEEFEDYQMVLATPRSG